MAAWLTESSHDQRVGDPFRTDVDFWRSVAASADAFGVLVASIALAAVLAALGASAWSLVAFVLPLPLLARASRAGARSSRRTRAAFDDRHAWRDAERTAVAKAFVPALLRRRLGRSPADR